MSQTTEKRIFDQFVKPMTGKMGVMVVTIAYTNRNQWGFSKDEREIVQDFILKLFLWDSEKIPFFLFWIREYKFFVLR